MINKEKILSNIKLDNDMKIIVFNILDIINRVLKNYEYEFTNFLNREVIAIIKSIEGNFYGDLIFRYYGGFEESEYQIVLILPSFLEYEEIEFPITLLESDNLGFTHREVLGTLMSLGIKREVVGDIVIYDSKIYIFALKSISEYIYLNLNKISRKKVEFKIKNVSEFKYIEKEFEILNRTVSSLRLDSVLSSAFNMSRSEASKYIKSDKVKVNYIFKNSNSFLVKESDIISCRGKGRIILSKIKGMSRKDRIKIEIKKYI